jgi:hypothetical protein
LPPWLGWPLWNICVTNDHGYVPLVVNTSRSFPHSWLISGFVTRLTRWVPLVEQELLTQGLRNFPKVHWSSTSEHQESTGPEYRNGGNKICWTQN